MNKDIKKIKSSQYLDRYDIVSMDIPYGIEEIECCAFYNCPNLQHITISNTVKAIGFSAFRFCSELDNIVIPDSVTFIGHDAFDNTKWYKNNSDDYVILSDKYLIKYNGKSENATIPKSVKYISPYTFDRCIHLKTITIPNGIKVIESFSFLGCSNIKSIIIPNSVEKISEYAFINCKKLESVSISENVKYISKKAFAGCSENLTIFAPKNSYGNKFAEENCIEYLEL